MKPLLAVNADLNKLKFPVYLSNKYDGVRAMVLGASLVSRTLKPIPNKYIRETLESYADVLEGFDGELIVGSPTAPDCFSKTTSAVMSRDGEPDFKFYVFDKVDDALGDDYETRWLSLDFEFFKSLPSFIVRVPQHRLNTLEEVMQAEAVCVEQGYEGCMLRNNTVYKHGRSTVNEGTLLKLKRFEDFEAEIIGFEERMHNGNEATTDLLGHTERSSHKANMIPMNTLGALVVKSELYSEPFRVGTGFDDEQRRWIWDNRDTFLGMLAKIKHQPSGSLEGGLPRFPVFISIRDRDDISE